MTELHLPDLGVAVAVSVRNQMGPIMGAINKALDDAETAAAFIASAGPCIIDLAAGVVLSFRPPVAHSLRFARQVLRGRQSLPGNSDRSRLRGGEMPTRIGSLQLGRHKRH